MQITETSNEGLKRTLQVDRPRRRARQALRRSPGRDQGPRAAQGLPQGQGAGSASEEDVRPLADGRGAAGHRARDEQQGDRRPQGAPGDAAERQLARGSGRDRARALRPGRPFLLDDLRGAARHRARGLQEAEARAARRRRRRRSRRQGGGRARRPQRHVYARRRPRGAETGDRVTVDFVGKIDGEAFEGGTAEARRSCSARATSSPASRKASPAPRPARSATSSRPSRPTIRSPRWPAKLRTSPSR